MIKLNKNNGSTYFYNGIQLWDNVQVKLETVVFDVSVVEHCTKLYSPDQGRTVPLQVDTKAAEMIEFNGTIAVTIIKLSVLYNMELVWR